MRMNAIWNVNNPYQGQEDRVLCICSAGLLRSPTVAHILANRGYNTRAAGMHDYALIQVDEVLIKWADALVFAEQEHYNVFLTKFGKVDADQTVIVLNIPDNYARMDKTLVEIIEKKLDEIGFIKEESDEN